MADSKRKMSDFFDPFVMRNFARREESSANLSAAKTPNRRFISEDELYDAEIASACAILKNSGGCGCAQISQNNAQPDKAPPREEPNLTNFKKSEKNKKRLTPLILKASGLFLSISIFVGSTMLTGYHFLVTDFKEPVYSRNEHYPIGYLVDHPLKVYIDPTGATQRQIDLIKKSIIQLDEVLDTVNFEFVEGEAPKTFEFELGTLENDNFANIFISVNKDSNIFSNVLGFAKQLSYKPIVGNIVIEKKSFRGFGEKRAISTIQHEVLHALGLDHTKNITSIMYPVNLHSGVTQDAIEDVETIFPEK